MRGSINRRAACVDSPRERGEHLVLYRRQVTELRLKRLKFIAFQLGGIKSLSIDFWPRLGGRARPAD